MDLKEFGRFVARLRHERGLTQSQLAEELGVTDKAVSRWERAVGFPDITLLAPLASALGVSVSELVAARRFDAGESSPVSDSEAEDIAAASVGLAERLGRSVAGVRLAGRRSGALIRHVHPCQRARQPWRRRPCRAALRRPGHMPLHAGHQL